MRTLKLKELARHGSWVHAAPATARAAVPFGSRSRAAS